MNRTAGQLVSALKRLGVKWDDAIKDARDRRGQRHPFVGLLNLLVVGFASGATTLRGIEDLSADLSAVARRVLRLGRRVSDTTLYMLLAGQEVAGLRETLVAQVRHLIRGKRVRNDLFRFGVVAFDGKSTWTSTTKTIEGAKQSTTDGVTTFSLMTERAVLVSSSARPLLDLEMVADKSGESPAFRQMFPRVAEAYTFDIATGDAGLTARENAQMVRDAGRHYLFMLKGNQERLHTWAEAQFLFAPGKVLTETRERRSGGTMWRRLYALDVDPDAAGLPGVRQLWLVEQHFFHDRAGPSVERRYFVSSMPKSMLSPNEKLSLVRLHWGIENGNHWTMDTAFQEDDRQPCQLSRRSVEVVCWLRAIAYNTVAVVRSRAVAASKPRPWRRVMQKLRDLFVTGLAEDHHAFLA